MSSNNVQMLRNINANFIYKIFIWWIGPTQIPRFFPKILSIFFNSLICLKLSDWKTSSHFSPAYRGEWEPCQSGDCIRQQGDAHYVHTNTRRCSSFNVGPASLTIDRSFNSAQWHVFGGNNLSYLIERDQSEVLSANDNLGHIVISHTTFTNLENLYLSLKGTSPGPKSSKNW